MRTAIEQCGRETNHALVVSTGFCACTHATFDYDPILDAPKPRCSGVRGGGGRVCSRAEGHRGPHVYECGR